LAQTPFPGIQISATETPASLLEILAPLGADVLMKALTDRVFVPPFHPVGLSESQIEEVAGGRDISHAPRITPEDRRIFWDRMSSAEIVRRDHVLRNLWDTTTYNAFLHGSSENSSSGMSETTLKRIIFSQGFSVDRELCERFCKIASQLSLPPGTPMVLHDEDHTAKFGVRTVDGAVVVNACTIEGGQKDKGVAELVRLAEKWS
jgi:methionyl-tRNA formyltransferase